MFPMPWISHVGLPSTMYTFQLDFVYLCSDTNSDLLFHMYQFAPLPTTNVCGNFFIRGSIGVLNISVWFLHLCCIC